jgi:hypothetical protein
LGVFESRVCVLVGKRLLYRHFVVETGSVAGDGDFDAAVQASSGSPGRR